MRQYLKTKIEFIVILVTLIVAMIFQYLRISNLDIAFLYEINVSSTFVYLPVILLIPVIVLVFIFAPLMLVFEISINIEFPKLLEIKISRDIFSVKPISRKYISNTKYITVFRC